MSLHNVNENGERIQEKDKKRVFLGSIKKLVDKSRIDPGRTELGNGLSIANVKKADSIFGD